jgi:hypothetical protein
MTAIPLALRVVDESRLHRSRPEMLLRIKMQPATLNLTFHGRARDVTRSALTDCAFCACTLCADCAAIAIVGRGDNESLIASATLSRLRLGDSILAAEQLPRPSTPQARHGSAQWWGSANTLGPRQILARGAHARVFVAVSPMWPGHSARGGDLLRVEFHCASDESILFR